MKFSLIWIFSALFTSSLFSSEIAWHSSEQSTTGSSSSKKNGEQKVSTPDKFKSGFYIGPNGGVNFLNGSSKYHMTIHSHVGYAVGVEVGYRWRQGVRFEFETAYRYNGIDYISFLGSRIHSHGHVWNISYLANVLYELPIGLKRWSLNLYLGGGIGYAHQVIKATNFNLAIEGSKNGFAGQAIAGLGYWINRNWDVAVEYRFRKGGASYLFDQTAQLAAKYHF